MTATTGTTKIYPRCHGLAGRHDQRSLAPVKRRTVTRNRRLQALFADMPVSSYEDACRWLASHPEAGDELFRLARAAGAVMPHGDGRWRGNGVAPDGWPM